MSRTPSSAVESLLPVPATQPTLSVEEVGQILGKSRSTVYALLRDEVILTIQLSPRRYLIPTAAFTTWLTTAAGRAPEAAG